MCSEPEQAKHSVAMTSSFSKRSVFAIHTLPVKLCFKSSILESIFEKLHFPATFITYAWMEALSAKKCTFKCKNTCAWGFEQCSNGSQQCFLFQPIRSKTKHNQISESFPAFGTYCIYPSTCYQLCVFLCLSSIACFPKLARVFLHLALIVCIPVLGTSCIFSCAWHRLCFFSYAYHQLHVFLCFALNSDWLDA